MSMKWRKKSKIKFDTQVLNLIVWSNLKKLSQMKIMIEQLCGIKTGKSKNANRAKKMSGTEHA